jgi:hypothetical protein
MSQSFSLEVRSTEDLAALERRLREFWSGGGVDGALTKIGTKVFCFSFFYGRYTPRSEIVSLINFLRSVADRPKHVWYWTSCGFEQPAWDQEKDADLECMYQPGAPEFPGFPEEEPRRFRVPLGRLAVIHGRLVVESDQELREK